MPKKRYDAEMASLERHFEGVSRWAGITELRETLMRLAGAPAIFVGTGGTSAVARLAASLHEQVDGQLARAVTPLELAMLPAGTRSGALLFSSGLRHPDALGALERLASNRLRPAAVITLRDAASVADVLPVDVQAISLPSLDFQEGFLATTSVLVMAAALVRAYGGDAALPKALPRPSVEVPPPTEQLLVLTTPSLTSVAIDIETRCHELGLTSVQVSDYRNFAHGRHVGLARRSKMTSVLGLVDRPLERLAAATLDSLPQDEMNVTAWRAEHSGPAAVIELLVASMEMTASFAAHCGVNPARPGAAPFGRRLYHLRLGRLLPPLADGPVERKLRSLGVALNADATRARYEGAFAGWLEQLGNEEFGGIVLDYDGTVCATGRRHELPDQAVTAGLVRLLENEVVLGFASGRGPSLHNDLRQWVPRSHWDRVIVGLYNGGFCGPLEEDLPDLSKPSPAMEAVVARVEALPVVDALLVEPRTHQVTLSLRPGAFGQIGRLAGLVVEAMAQSPELPVKVVQSGHSIDVVPLSSSKRLVIDYVSGLTAGKTMAIGDQGDIGGNDFELLAGDTWSLSVDECSADPTRCWYLDARGRGGPKLLAAYLDAMVPADGGFAIRWVDE